MYGAKIDAIVVLKIKMIRGCIEIDSQPVYKRILM